MDRGAWQATVHSIAKSWTWPKWLSMYTHLPIKSKKWEGGGRGGRGVGLEGHMKASCPFPRHLLHLAVSELYPFIINWASLVAQMVKHLPATRETWVQSLGWKDPLKNKMATHSSTLAWKIPWWRSLVGYGPWNCRVGHYWTTSLVHNKLVI